MKIKLAVLHGNIDYLKRLSSILESKYKDKLAVYSFTDMAVAMDTLGAEKIDVFLAEDSFAVDLAGIPPKCGFAYFVAAPEIDSFNGRPAVCQFQRTELLYKQILNIFSEAVGETSVRNIYSGNTKLIAFSSPCGGVGSSTLAAACAVRMARLGRRVLFLDLENFGGADAYFNAEGSFDMSDVIYAVKSRRSSLSIKLESYVRLDSSGVYFFPPAKVALDMLELSGEDKIELLAALEQSGVYDCIVIDTQFSMRDEDLALLRRVHGWVWAEDGQAVSRSKLQRAYAALKVLESGAQNPLTDRICTLQNKFVGQFNGALPELGIRCIGVVPKVRHKVDESIIGQAALSDALDAILDV